MKNKFKIILIGDECVDEFQYGTVTRINPEAPSPILDIEPEKKKVSKGMCGNVELNLVALAKQEAPEIIKLVTPTPTVKTRIVDSKSGQILLRLDSPKQKSEHFKLNSLKNIVEEHDGEIDAIVVSDYNKGFLNNINIRQIINIAKTYKIVTFFDTKKLIDSYFSGANFIKINSAEDAYNRSNNCLPESCCDNYIVTNGENGCVWINSGGRVKKISTQKVDVACVSGAGDTVLAALVTRYLECGGIEESINFSMAAASEVVKHRNVVAANRFEINHCEKKL